MFDILLYKHYANSNFKVLNIKWEVAIVLGVAMEEAALNDLKIQLCFLISSSIYNSEYH